jgi:hypothetical protein
LGSHRASLTSFVTGAASRGSCPRSGLMDRRSGSSRASARQGGAADGWRITGARIGVLHAQPSELLEKLKVFNDNDDDD